METETVNETAKETKKEKRRAALIAADCGDRDIDRSLAELRALAESADMEVVLEVSQRRDAPDGRAYLGAGRLVEAAELCKKNGAEVCVADDELTGTQIRNLENALGLPVIDRTLLIINIFAAHAMTSEGKLQTELAALQYRLPRLEGLREGLSRQGGGGAGGGGARRGGGESQLEYDRRYLRRRIGFIRQRLDELDRRRSETRRRRTHNDVPVAVLVGYTNVGKSSLQNRLCGSDTPVRDRLFETLDPTARRCRLPSGQTVVIVDTVGFVSRLPHGLVDAFRSTLEEAARADLILRVADAGDPEREQQLAVTREVLSEIGAAEVESFVVYNKCDLLHLSAPGSIEVSAKTGAGTGELLAEIDRRLAGRVVETELLIPYARMNLLDLLRREGRILQLEYRDDGVRLRAQADRQTLAKLAGCIVYN